MSTTRCSKWMPRAKEYCAGPENHQGDCRTAARVARDIVRYTNYKRTRYNSDENFRKHQLDRMQKKRQRVRKDDPVLYRKRQALANAKQRAQKVGVPFDLTIDTVPDIPEFCPVLGLELNLSISSKTRDDNCPSLDRIIPELGYIVGNIAWISWRANRLKSDSTYQELEQILNYIKSANDVCEVPR
jgi:hypothetical protein